MTRPVPSWTRAKRNEAGKFELPGLAASTTTEISHENYTTQRRTNQPATTRPGDTVKRSIRFTTHGVPVQIRTLCICGRPATVKTEHGRRCWTCLRKRLEKEARHYIAQFADDMRRGRIDNE
jgi:hypothetical protein